MTTPRSARPAIRLRVDDRPEVVCHLDEAAPVTFDPRRAPPFRLAAPLQPLETATRFDIELGAWVGSEWQRDTELFWSEKERALELIGVMDAWEPFLGADDVETAAEAVRLAAPALAAAGQLYDYPHGFIIYRINSWPTVGLVELPKVLNSGPSTIAQQILRVAGPAPIRELEMEGYYTDGRGRRLGMYGLCWEEGRQVAATHRDVDGRPLSCQYVDTPKSGKLPVLEAMVGRISRQARKFGGSGAT